jgi:TetR/AcrR family transcriptional regulator, transcriptional repressor for nem operon
LEVSPVPGITTKESTKTLLLEKGTEIMLEKGYNNTGIMEVLQSTGVPKGSFYHYFESKEDFGLQIINHFDQLSKEKLRTTVLNQSVSPIQRLKSYCELGIEYFRSQKCRKGCLISNLSQEMADQNEIFRARLLDIQNENTKVFAACLKEAQEAGEICKSYNPTDLAELFQAAWGGAVLRSKICKTVDPMQSFMELMFGKMLTP